MLLSKIIYNFLQKKPQNSTLSSAHFHNVMTLFDEGHPRESHSNSV